MQYTQNRKRGEDICRKKQSTLFQRRHDKIMAVNGRTQTEKKRFRSRKIRCAFCRNGKNSDFNWQGRRLNHTCSRRFSFWKG